MRTQKNKTSIRLLIISLVIGLNSFSQDNRIEIVTQNKLTNPTDSIISNLLVGGIKIIESKSNLPDNTHALGSFKDPLKRMGISNGLILSTGIVDNVNQENSQENYTTYDVEEAYKAYEVKVEEASSQSQPKIIGKLLLKEANLISDTLLLANNDYDKPIDINKDKAYAAPKAISFSNVIKAGDTDLSSEIEGIKTFDARVIEVKLIPTDDSLYFRYVFASEEYDEYVCSPFNDIFAFYLYEEGSIKKNIALVPKTNIPVSINTVNNGNPSNKSCVKSNSYLYQKNNGTQNLLYDGYTKVLDIRRKVIPGNTYFLKIAIADASDGAFDSAVLLENGSMFSYKFSKEISFSSNSSSIEDENIMKQILLALRENPKNKVQLIGHADKIGSEEQNHQLSLKRLKSVERYLVDNGINSKRITSVAKGESMPRYKESSKNRRVEVFVLGE